MNNKITFKAILLVKILAFSAILCLCLFFYFFFEGLDRDSSNYLEGSFIFLGFGLLGLIYYFSLNRVIEIDKKNIKVTFYFFSLYKIRKHHNFHHISSLEMVGLPMSKSLKIIFTDGSILNLNSNVLLDSGELPELKFHGGAIHGPARDLYRLKFFIEQSLGITDPDPFPPYVL